LLFILWVSAWDPEVTHSTLVVANVTALTFHIATIVEITQKSFSYYHTTVAVQLLLSTVIPFGCALFQLRWRGLGRGSRIAGCLNCLAIAGWAFYLQATKGSAEVLETQCLAETTSFAADSSTTFYMRQSYVNLDFIPAILFVLLPGSAFLPNRNAMYALLSPWLFGVTLTSIHLQYLTVAHFQPYTDGTEQSWGFGQIGTVVALAGPLYEIVRIGRQIRAGERDGPKFFKRNCKSCPWSLTQGRMRVFPSVHLMDVRHHT
jgi:hypothetical protein